MPALNPDGLPVTVGGVVVTSPGLRGEVDVLLPDQPGTRGQELSTDDFLAVLARQDVDQDVTIRISEQQELDVGTGSRAAGGSDDITLEVPDPGEAFGQVVLYAAEDGSLSWHFPERSTDGGVTRGSSRLTYRIPRTVITEPAGDGTRGLLGAIGTKLMKVLVFRLIDVAAGAGANYFARRFEAAHRPHRLRAFTPDGYRLPDPVDLDDDAIRALCNGPALLFVHGTASTSHHGFGRIPPATFALLHRMYQGRVLAFDHPTVSVTPTENVEWLAERLAVLVDRRWQVDVVSHSRGGLVARDLTEHPELTAGRVAVDRLVMVASPNAGTALADPTRIDQLLNRLTTLLQIIPDNGVTDVLDIVLAIVKQLAVGAFQGLDGLMSMNPHGSYLTTYLNRPSTTTARYFAVASNFEPPQGSPLLRVARDHATDVVFKDVENDLVVPTGGVFTVPGASAFPIAAPVLFAAADGVDHSGYWTHEPLTAALTSWLDLAQSRFVP